MNIPLRFLKRSFAIAGSLLSLLPADLCVGQTASFTAPDTVLTGASVTISNTSTGGTTWYWSFCAPDPSGTPVVKNIGNPGNSLDGPVYGTLVKDGNDCFGFFTNSNLPTQITRIYYGSGFGNPPVSTAKLLQTGVLHDYVEGIQISESDGVWYGFVCNNNTILRLTFGATLWNDNPAVTDLGPFPLVVAHGMKLLREGNTWLLFFDSSTDNKLFRLDFGNSLANTPVFTDLGNIASFSHPTQIAAVKENGNCFLLINNYDNNTLSRISFGTSWLNTPAGQNLGNCGGLDKPHGLILHGSCGPLTGFYTGWRMAPLGSLGRLTFTGGAGGAVSAQPLGNPGNLNNPSSFTEWFRKEDTLCTYISNAGDQSITLLSLPPCNNASVPSSTLFDPPTYSYDQPGIYTIRLIMDEGLPTESVVCKQIVVKEPDAVTAAFTGPDTVCVNSPVDLTNLSTPGRTYLWNFCSGNLYTDPAAVNIGNPGFLLGIPTYIDMVRQGNDCFSFVSCQGTGVVRYYHGNSFGNDPVSWTNLGNLGLIDYDQEGIQVRFEPANGHWYAFVNSDNTLVRLDFGNSLFNAPTGIDLGPFPMLNMAHGLVIAREGNRWVGFITCSLGGNLVRLDFGNSLANVPTATNFGNLGGVLTLPGALSLFNENGQWHALVISGPSGLARISFGTSLITPPVAQSLGNPGGFSNAVGLTALPDCETVTGYWLNYNDPGQMGKLLFPQGITGPATGALLPGNPGSLRKPHSFSNLVREGDYLYAYITNRQDGTLTRLSFPPCSNASVPSSSLFDPPLFSYNQPGTYNIRLVVDEGLPTQTIACKKIVVSTALAAAFTVPDTVCEGTAVQPVNQSGTGRSYRWDFCQGSSLPDPAGTNLGNPGFLLGIPAYVSCARDNSGCYSFVTNQVGGYVIRYRHGSSFSGAPANGTFLIGPAGSLNDSIIGIKVVEDNGRWLAFVNNNRRIVRFDFGTSLSNTPVATLLGSWPMLYVAHCIDLFREGPTWIGFLTCSLGNKLVRLDFGTSLLNTPLLTDLGAPGGLNYPGSFRFMQENGQWYALVSNMGNGTITRLSFGTSLKNPPTGQNLGMVCPGTNPGGLCLIRECEKITGFYLNYSSSSNNLLWRLDLPGGMTGSVTGSSIPFPGLTDRPAHFSEVLREGDSLMMYVTNRGDGTLARLVLPPCPNPAAPSSTLFEPPPVTFPAPGTYTIRLTADEGTPCQGNICHQVTVVEQPEPGQIDTTLCFGVRYFAGGAWQTTEGVYTDTIPLAGRCDSLLQTTLRYRPEITFSLGKDTTLCNGNIITLRPGIPADLFRWQDGSTDSLLAASIPGIYWVTVTRDGCEATDSIRLRECQTPLWFPNVFTPNGDALNNTFHPVGQGVADFSLLVFDRWGRKLYETGSMEPGWDGTFAGKPCADGVYVFISTYRMADAPDMTWHVKGTVTLLR